MHRNDVVRSSRWKIARFSILYAVLGGAAILYGETQLEQSTVQPNGVFWLEGRGWWAPDYGQCCFCGSDLIPRVDEASACRHCEHCILDFRHKSLPKTLEEQERVWK